MHTPMAINGKQPHITIILDDSKEDEKILKQFHCPVCGKVVFEYYSTIKMIVPGYNGGVNNPKVIQCHGKIQLYVNGEYINTKCKSKFWVV
jgi:hypothetical protein